VRSKTVEPVLGTLINFTNMKKVNTRGIKQANKHVLMATLTYNLKKYLKFISKKSKSQVGIVCVMEAEAQLFLNSFVQGLKQVFLSLLFFETPCRLSKINLVYPEVSGALNEVFFYVFL